ITSHFYISINRANMNFPVVIDDDKIVKQVKDEVKQATKDIVLRIQETMRSYFSEAEVDYLVLHMGAKLSSSAYKNQESNLVISRKIDELSSRMLEMIQKSFNIDFRNNLELHMSLNQHMVPLDIRMQYSIPLSNPLLHEIKKECAFAYTMAATACIVLSEHYHNSIPEDEIGYFAILFELALEKKDKKVDKKNIVMVCASGKGTTQLFMYKYTKAFGKYINNIYECTAYELEYFDLVGKEIDYIFTTVPISLNVPVPVFEVNLFLEDKDIVAYREIFETSNNAFLSEFYYSQLFLTDIKATTKEETIRILCQHTDKHFHLPAEFYNAVMKRETMGQTDFGNLVAIPHPFQVMTKQNFVTVGILEKPIWWGHKEVQVVFLISISSDEHVDAEQFYQLTTRLLFDAKSIQYLIDNPRFDVLLSLLGGA
ncbi:TPA: PRD domain-containing protein, partial [Enterobacter hormaechei subsp. steigerwaltii]|nr:PRD domain-containing protein [Enterobacter hormaechei subsp. steigerwaltii]